MKTLVVGGAGYIGSVVTRQLVSEGHHVVVLDDCSTGHADAVPEGVELVQTDITNTAQVQISQRAFNNAGTMSWSGTGDIGLDTSASINNQAGATFTLSNNQTVVNNGGAAAVIFVVRQPGNDHAAG